MNQVSLLPLPSLVQNKPLFPILMITSPKGQQGVLMVKHYYVDSKLNYKDWKKTFVDGGSKEGMTEVTATGKDKLPVNTESEVYKKLGEEHYNGLHNILNEHLKDKRLFGRSLKIS
jgi:hypothetical protein